MNLWQQILERVESKVNRHSFDRWFRPTRLLSETSDHILVQVPNEQFRDWLSRQYSSVIHESLAEMGRPGVQVSFEVVVHDPSDPSPPTLASAPRDELLLNPKYTFDTFVVGASNQFAHAAARAVAESPARAHNPLFIYGGVGLGKTHLLHAIAQELRKQNAAAKLVYIPAERFMNDLINAIRYDRILQFREKHRSSDVLLLDDVQFIAGKERTQEEFFHTFNALYDSQKQIVLSSDSPPRQIPTLEERLRSRFVWGLTADIQPPDLETKIAILRKKADALQKENLHAAALHIPDNVAIFIASKIKSNIRELEGSLTRLVAYADISDRPIDLPLAQEVLRDLLPTQDRVINLDMIQKFVADHYNLSTSELRARNNSKSVALPRQIAMYLSKSLTNASLPDIGKSFGGKHHSTVIHSIKKIQGLRKSDSDFDRLIQNFLDSFR